MKRIGTLATIIAILLMVSFVAQGAAWQSKKKKRQRPVTKMGTVSIGRWGGMHVGMEVDANGAQLDFDCAHATITQPLKLDANGNFDVEGLYVRERGGPVRSNEDQSGQRAHFKGRLNGNSLTLTIVLADAAEPIGTYTLEFGKYGRVFKCM